MHLYVSLLHNSGTAFPCIKRTYQLTGGCDVCYNTEYLKPKKPKKASKELICVDFLYLYFLYALCLPSVLPPATVQKIHTPTQKVMQF